MRSNGNWPRWAWLAAGAAVALGSLLLWTLGAPQRMPLVNLAALPVGLAAALLIRALERAAIAIKNMLVLAAAAAILAVAMFGAQADGIARWVVVAGLTLQPSLIVVPLVALAFAVRPRPARVAAVGVAALGCALQPDLGAAAMLVAAVLAAALVIRSAAAGAAALLAVAGLAAAAMRPVGLPPVPFVEQVVPAALAAGAVPAALALIAMAILFAPALLLHRSAPPRVLAAFAALWLAALLAALLGPYPTPVLGFGGSAVLGYLLSVACLTRSLMLGRADQPKAIA